MVVVEGLMFRVPPLVAVAFPGVITPVPPEKLNDRIVPLPWEMLMEAAVKAEITGVAAMVLDAVP